MVKKILADLEFNSLIGESQAQTETGHRILDRYKSWIMNNESSCKLVNQFVAEASQCRYDSGVNAVLEKIADYIQCNRTGWALSTVCETLNQGKTSWNYLNAGVVKQIEELLEGKDETTINKYIKAGALKNAMYVTEVRNVVKQALHNTPVIETDVNCDICHPISLVENCGDGYMFSVMGRLIKIDSDHTITEGNWDDASQMFRTVTSLLESRLCSYDEATEIVTVKYDGHEYSIQEANKVNKDGKEITVEQLRDENRLKLMTCNQRQAHQIAQVLEAIALLSENFEHVAKMDNASLCTTAGDRFLVVCEDTNMFATLIQSNHSTGWTYNGNTVETLEGIKKSTRVNLSENFTAQVRSVIEQATADDQARIAKELKEAEKDQIKARIEALTEQFKNDPTKLAVLSQLAQQLQAIND